MIKYKRLAIGFRCSNSAKSVVYLADHKDKVYPFPKLCINVLIYTSNPSYF